MSDIHQTIDQEHETELVHLDLVDTEVWDIDEAQFIIIVMTEDEFPVCMN